MDHRGKIDVLDAVLVMNDDGSATLSARIVNNTDQPREIGDVTISDMDAFEDFPVRFFGHWDPSAIEPGATVTTGGIHDPVRVRIARGVEPGKTVPLELRFDPSEAYDGNSPTVLLDVPVVVRSEIYAEVSGNTPNKAISIENGKIFVISGQKKAYVDGTVISDIHDCAYEVPSKAVADDGRRVEYKHQTATGGPYSLCTKQADLSGRIGYPPYTETEGDADYVDAKDVKIGEKISVTIPFESGDVVGVFTVVAG